MNVLYQIKLKNANRLISLHINSLRNKFEMLEEIIKDKISIFLIFETKLDRSFQAREYIIKIYSTTSRLDRNQSGIDLLLYLCEDMPCQILNEYTSEKPIENIFVEINLKSRKWLLLCSLNPNTNLTAYHLHFIGKEIDSYSSKNYNFIVLSDLSTEISKIYLEQLCASYDLKSLIKEPACFKSAGNLSYIFKSFEKLSKLWGLWNWHIWLP